MYAVIESGGKQYRVSVGDKLRVESLAVTEGETLDLDKVLAISDAGDLKVGTPHLGDTKVQATVLAHGRGDKIRVFKMKRRKNYRRHYGHRQNYTELEITAIGDVKTAPAKKTKAKKATPKADTAAKKSEGKKVKKATATKKKVIKKTSAKTTKKTASAAGSKKVTKKAASKKKTTKKASASKSDK